MAEKGESSEAARKKKRLSLSLKRRKEENSASPLKKRFAKTSDQEMQSLKVKPMSKNTERSQRWALNVFKEWVRSNDWPEVEVERLWNEADSKKVCEMLCRFIVEAKQRSGEPYCPKTLLQLLINLQSYAGSQNPTASNFLDTDDQVFKPLHHVLNNHSKKLLTGFVHQVHLENKVVTQYANPSLGERCFVNLFERYVSLLPEDAKGRNLFYCKPKKTISKEDTSWYFNIPVGHLSIGGVRSYERTTDAQRMEVSKVLSSTNAMKTASSQCEETDISTSKLATLQSIEKLPLPSGEDKENKMFNFQNLTGCTINFNILVISKFIISLSLV